MASQRDWKTVLNQLASVAIFSIVAYGHQGSVVHRSIWDRQKLWLPLLYTLCPHIYFCQILLNVLLCWHRRGAMRRLHGRTVAGESFCWYLCAIFGMHTRSRVWSDPEVFIAGIGSEKRTGMLRLHNLHTVNLRPVNKYTDGKFDAYSFSGQLGWLVLQLYQVTMGCIRYAKRVMQLPNGTLDVDHLAAMYALNGALVTLATLILHCQPYEWDDPNEYDGRTRIEMSDIDTSNAWVYEGFTALTLQLALWTGLRLWAFGRTISLPGKAWSEHFSSPWELFAESLSPAGIVLTVVLVAGIPLLARSIRDLWIPYRQSLTWLNVKLGLDVRTGGAVIRTALAVMMIAITTAIWHNAFQELREVSDGNVDPWNKDWASPNPGIQSILDVIWCLNC